MVGTIADAKIDGKCSVLHVRQASFLVDFDHINFLFVQFIYEKVLAVDDGCLWYELRSFRWRLSSGW